MIQSAIHSNILDQREKVSTWFEEKKKNLRFPIYSSFDIRDSGSKVAPVDANIFPAGFNNICRIDKDHAPEIFESYFSRHYPGFKGQIGLLTEEHTGNLFYWDNVATIASLLSEAGQKVILGVPSSLNEAKIIKLPSGSELVVHGSNKTPDGLSMGKTPVDLIISNNDFSSIYDQWDENLQVPINPPRELGWYQRKKSAYFLQYNLLAEEFAGIIGAHPLDLQIKTEVFEPFDVFDPDNLAELAYRVDQFLENLNSAYQERGIDYKPFCFIKNNMGTYGLGVTQVSSGEEIKNWNNKTRKKMQASKGGQTISSVIIQEGIPTRFKDDSGATAEPCIYMVGDQLVGGFLRTHAQKSNHESLNSPGAVFKRLCMSDLIIKESDCPMENVYGWTSKLSALALAFEAQLANVPFKNYQI